MKNTNKIALDSINYSPKKSVFSAKEVIIRGGGKAKVWTISSKMQVCFLFFVVFFAVWSFYYYFMYQSSDHIINHKDNELVETRDAYLNLMGDFVTLQAKISEMLENIKKEEKPNEEIAQYKQQAHVVSDKIKAITDEKDWINAQKLEEQTNINEVSLQRDIALFERNEFYRQLKDLQELVKDIQAAEEELLEKVATIASDEVSKIKGVVDAINKPLKRKGLYFNIMANDKRGNSGGMYIPVDNKFLQDEKISSKINKIFADIDNVEYYREILKNVPIGKPTQNTWISSRYGIRKDPIKNTRAYHKGLDFAGRVGTPIRVQANGKVTKAGYNSSYGNLLVIDHGNGFVTKYAHLNKNLVKKGDYVKRGDIIGELGNTGRSTGPHLHYEVLYKGKDVDPLPFAGQKVS